jgi:hypothetical protein
MAWYLVFWHRRSTAAVMPAPTSRPGQTPGYGESEPRLWRSDGTKDPGDWGGGAAIGDDR